MNLYQPEFTLWFQKHKIRIDAWVLRVLCEIGVDAVQDLKHLDEDITNICAALNKIGSKKFCIVLQAKENPEESV